jgi:hypothetical protein
MKDNGESHDDAWSGLKESGRAHRSEQEKRHAAAISAARQIDATMPLRAFGPHHIETFEIPICIGRILNLLPPHVVKTKFIPAESF